MRPGQQNRRVRGRGNSNRKGPNPLSRNYESNGPDVKIRGNAQHIAEKYTTLARDSQASGDRVIAENYLQHAEHYNRIIMAAQLQNPQPMQRDESYDDDSYDDDDNHDHNIAVSGHSTNTQSSNGHSNGQHQLRRTQNEVYDGSGPQPVIDGTPAEVIYVDDRAGHAKSSGDNNRTQNSRPQNRLQRPRRQPRMDARDEERVNQRSEAQPSEQSEPQPNIETVAEAPLLTADLHNNDAEQNEPVAAAPVRRRAASVRTPRVARTQVDKSAESEAGASAEVETGEASSEVETEIRRPRRVVRPRRTAAASEAADIVKPTETVVVEKEAAAKPESEAAAPVVVEGN